MWYRSNCVSSKLNHLMQSWWNAWIFLFCSTFRFSLKESIFLIYSSAFPSELLWCVHFEICSSVILFLLQIVSQRRGNMSLACLCYSVDSPSHSIRSYSVSSSDSDGRCSAMVSCLRKVSALHDHGSADMTSKVYPQPIVVAGQGLAGAPRLVRSRAVRRDFVRDWNFDDVLGENWRVLFFCLF